MFFIIVTFDYSQIMNTELLAGLCAGSVSALLFNPIDKVIFSCCSQNKRFFDRNTWTNLFRGSLNNLGTRLITSGLYFSYIDHYASVSNSKVEVSLVTALLCSITNPLQLCRYNSWYVNCCSRATVDSIYKKYGMRGFAIGIYPLIARDFVFNYIYLSGRTKDNHCYNLGVICTALVVTSPINLVRNMKYAKNESVANVMRNFKYSQLGLGMVTMRSCVAFYAGQLIYDLAKGCLSTFQV